MRAVDADLHMAQLMPLPLTVSCCRKCTLVLPFWYQLTWVVPNKGPWVMMKVQNSTIFHTPLVFLGRIQNVRILRSGSASGCKFPRYLPILSCAVSQFLLHRVITIHQRYRRTDRRDARSISVTCDDCM